MRYLQCQHIEIDTQNQLISLDGEVITLPPKVFDLLIYFCHHSERVITKDELMEQVWLGTYVTENAISRTLVKVRKVLNDDPKSPQFIVTVPRKGYRMVKSFTKSDVSMHTKDGDSGKSDNKDAHYQNVKSNQYLPVKLFVLAVTCLVAFTLYFYTDSSLSLTAASPKLIKPISREVGQELYPEISPDGAYSSYTIVNDALESYLMIENQYSRKKIQVRVEGLDLTKLTWSSDSKKVAFLAKTDQECSIYTSDLATIKQKDTWFSVTSCSRFSNPQLLFHDNDTAILFNDKPSSTNGYQIYQVNLERGERQIINQPITGGKGNYAFDISPDGSSLVMLNSEYEPVTSLYKLDLKTSELTKTGQVDYLMRSVVFAYDNASLVHPSPHPAYELWQSSLEGKKLGVMASNTSRVKHVKRITGTTDYVFVSYLLNRDISVRKQPNSLKVSKLNESVKNINSSVMDYLPALANHSSSYAFVSKRTTGAEVYYVQENQEGHNAPIQLTHFEKHTKLYHLAFSPNDKNLAILADNQLFIAQLATGSIYKVPFKNMSIQGLSWYDDGELLFTTIRDNNGHLVTYNIADGVFTDVAKGYYGGIYLKRQNQLALISEYGRQIDIMDESGKVVDTLPISCHPTIISRKVNLQHESNNLICYSQNTNSLQSIDLNTKRVRPWHKLPSNVDFDANASAVLFTSMNQAIADIMRTTSK